jgi:hypothetical protein
MLSEAELDALEAVMDALNGEAANLPPGSRVRGQLLRAANASRRNLLLNGRQLPPRQEPAAQGNVIPLSGEAG